MASTKDNLFCYRMDRKFLTTQPDHLLETIVAAEVTHSDALLAQEKCPALVWLKVSEVCVETGAFLLMKASTPGYQYLLDNKDDNNAFLIPDGSAQLSRIAVVILQGSRSGFHNYSRPRSIWVDVMTTNTVVRWDKIAASLKCLWSELIRFPKVAYNMATSFPQLEQLQFNANCSSLPPFMQRVRIAEFVRPSTVPAVVIGHFEQQQHRSRVEQEVPSYDFSSLTTLHVSFGYNLPWKQMKALETLTIWNFKPAEEEIDWPATLSDLTLDYCHSFVSVPDCLRTLKMSSTNVKQLPRQIKRLSCTVEQLTADTIEELTHLEFLEVTDADRLVGQPRGFLNLTNNPGVRSLSLVFSQYPDTLVHCPAELQELYVWSSRIPNLRQRLDECPKLRLLDLDVADLSVLKLQLMDQPYQRTSNSLLAYVWIKGALDHCLDIKQLSPNVKFLACHESAAKRLLLLDDLSQHLPCLTVIQTEDSYYFPQGRASLTDALELANESFHEEKEAQRDLWRLRDCLANILSQDREQQQTQLIEQASGSLTVARV